MARKVTLEFLIAQGIPEAQARRIMEAATAQAPRQIAWVFKATEQEAAMVVKAARAAGLKDFNVVKRFKSGKGNGAPAQ